MYRDQFAAGAAPSPNWSRQNPETTTYRDQFAAGAAGWEGCDQCHAGWAWFGEHGDG